MNVIDNAVYVDGVRIADPPSLDETFELARDRNGLAWIGLYRPDEAELRAVADEFELHELPVEDAIVAHQRAKMERYGSTLFLVLLPARYLDDVEKVEFGELHVFVGRNFVITVRHAESPNLHLVRRRLENAPGLLCMGPEAILYAILDQVVDEYAPVVAGLENDIDEIEDQLFGGEPAVSKRIYALFGEVIELQRAVHPLVEIFNALEAGFEKYRVDIELQRNLRDVADHVTRVVERVDGFRALLQNILSVHLTLETKALTEVSIAQNEQVQKISAWAAILFAPTLIGTVYGMNFDTMPELHWRLGSPMAGVLMFVVSLVLYLVFKRRRWI
jgi:magnesium transporter